VEPVTSDAPLIEGFDIGNLGRATARFDEAELERLNSQILHHMDHAAVAGRTGLTEAEWNAVRGNIASVAEAEQWKGVIRGPIAAPAQPDEDRAYLAAAADTLAGLPFDAGIWGALTEALKGTTGRKGKALFAPLRLALTGQSNGPDMAALLPLIGRDEALKRLAG
jgi:glutamyl-tRNA synthetase